MYHGGEESIGNYDYEGYGDVQRLLVRFLIIFFLLFNIVNVIK